MSQVLDETKPSTPPEPKRGSLRPGDVLGMHFFSPELTFALPRAPGTELLFRFHHRSGVYGLISDAHGGAQYGTVGLRLRF